jgi:prepilin-type N-terminal cleavage/methylation domain-containing protein
MQKCKGFTLIEVLTALFVLTIGMVGVTALLTRTASFTSAVNSTLKASFLAQEGLEIARNTRDTNFLKIRKGLLMPIQWSEGLAQGQQPPIPFQRTITVNQLQAGILQVSAKVSWTEKGAPKSVTASTYLTNWLNPSP